MSSFRRQRASVPERQFDNFLRTSLRSALWRVEPSPAVWQRIQHQLGTRQSTLPGRVPLRTLARNWQLGLLWVQRTLLAAPSWQERLVEHRMRLCTQMITYPHVSCMPLVAV